MSSNNIANPFNHYVTGNKREYFTYDSGNKMYAVRFQGKCHIPMNLLFFANSEEHVKDVLKNWVEFRKTCHDKYLKIAVEPHGPMPIAEWFHDLDDFLNDPSYKGDYVLEIEHVEKFDHPIVAGWDCRGLS